MRRRHTQMLCGACAIASLLATTAAATPDPTTQVAFSSTRLGGADQSHIFIMRADGSDVRKLTPKLGGGDYVESSPTWSPDGTRVAFVAGPRGDGSLCVINADGSAMSRLTDLPGDDRTAEWSPDGDEIVFASGSPGRFELFAIRPDGGDLRQVTDDRSTAISGTWSPSSREIVYVSAEDGTDTFHLRRIARSGKGGSDVLTHPGAGDIGPSWSPRGTHVAYQASAPRGPHEDIWLVDVETGEISELSDDRDRNMYPDWSPRGTHIIFASAPQGGTYDLCTMTARGDAVRRLTTHPAGDFVPAWDKSSVLSTSAAGKRPFTWGWLKGLATDGR